LETGLVSYWQFNEGSGDVANDHIGGNHGDLINMYENDWITSTIPIGGGVSNTQTEADSIVDFFGTGLSMFYNYQAGAQVTVTRIDTVPNINPTGPDTVFDTQYWVVNRFGSGTFHAHLAFTIAEDLTTADQNDPSNISLYTRASNADTNWVFLTSAIAIDAVNNVAVFSNITSFSQFIIARETELPCIELNLTAFLEGPYNEATGLMLPGLNPDDIPLSQPYNTVPWNYLGLESVMSIPNADIVDWVLIELRDTTDAALATGETMIARQAAFILDDGSVVGLGGNNGACSVVAPAITNNLFVVIWHRNHLGILSANALTQTGGIYSYDFSTVMEQVYNGGAGYKEVTTGVYGMVAGDANADGEINTTDNSLWQTNTGTKGYLSTDYDMNQQVNNQDKNDKWFPNRSYESQVPE